MTDGVARLEILHKDANHALFMVLSECCDIIVAIGDVQEGPPASIVAYATKFRSWRVDKLHNKQIAECAYRLVAEFRYWQRKDDPRAIVVGKMLKHLVSADRWEQQLK
jgi:hypothetical protein